ncbi:MAG: hypothetical protein JXA28_10865 [Bacteroidetes bacterium]|nr:hypothetical protein [Bacteroidota bacterium]
MKIVVLLFLPFLLLLTVSLSTTVSAQEKASGKEVKTTVRGENAQEKGPRFVDEDGDGICDHQKEGRLGRKQNSRNCDGTHQRARLRDGSCSDNTAAPSGSPRRGQGRNK